MSVWNRNRLTDIENQLTVTKGERDIRDVELTDTTYNA